VTPYVFEENGVESDVARVSMMDVNERDSIRIAGDAHPLKVSYALALADSTDFLLTDLIERCPDPVYGASIRRIKSMARRIREHEAEIERLRSEDHCFTMTNPCVEPLRCKGESVKNVSAS
jgi:hypothetical protein